MRLLAAVACLLVAAACSSPAPPQPSASPDPLLRPANVEEYRRVVASFKGRPLVVNLWASWCIPCKDEMPRLVAAARRYEDRVGFLGVDVMDDTEDALAFIRRFGVPFPSLADRMGAIKAEAKAVGLPTTLFYAPDGSLAFVHNGEIQQDELESRLREVVNLKRD